MQVFSVGWKYLTEPYGSFKCSKISVSLRGFLVLHISLAACELCALSGSWMWAFNHPASILLCHCDFFFLSFLMASKFQNETTWTLRFRILTTEILKPEKPCENEPLYLSVSSLLSADCWFYWDQLKCLQSWWSVTKWMLLISLNNKTKTFTSEHQLF